MKKNFFNLLLSIILLLGSNITAKTQTTLSVGDIAFIGLYMDGLSTSGDGFTFILLKNLDAGTVIYFTDEGWDASPNNTWYGNSNDAHISWTVPTGGLPIGTIVYIVNTTATTFTASSGTVSSTLSGTWNLSSSGDQMLAYQSSSGARPANPTFIDAVDADYYIGSTYDGTDGWGSSYYNQPYCSYIPAGLTNGTNCVALVNGVTAVGGGYAVGYECDNYKYTGTLTGTTDALRTAIHTNINWNGNEDGTMSIVATAYPIPNITASSTAPTITTQAVSGITATTATGNGNITSLGVPNPTAHGVCWNTTGAPTTANFVADNGAASVTGAFTASMTSLTANTTYYVRAFATNTAGTSYGSEEIFTTATPTIAFNMASTNGTESISTTYLQVDLSAVSGIPVTVDYTVTGTASGGGTDYTLANGTLTIPASNTSNDIIIAGIVNDLLDETDETVIITLSTPVNATLGQTRSIPIPSSIMTHRLPLLSTQPSQTAWNQSTAPIYSLAFRPQADRMLQLIIQ